MESITQEQDVEPKETPSKTLRNHLQMSSELKTVFVIAIVIFLHLSADKPVESLQSTLNEQSGLGTFSLACLYGPYFFSSFTTPAIVRILTPKWTVFLAFVFHSFYIGANFYPTLYTLIPGAVLLGVLCAPLYTVKDLYISSMAKQSVKPRGGRTQKGYQTKLTFYNGIVLSGVSFSVIMGQIISSVVLMQSSTNVTAVNCGVLNCPEELRTFGNSSNETVFQTKPEKYLIYSLFGVLLFLVLAGCVVTALALQQIPLENKRQPLKSSLLSCSRRLSDPKMILVVPQVAMFGYFQALLQAVFTRAYITCGVGVGMIGYVLMCRGASAAIPSVACGHLVKYTGRQSQVVVALLGYCCVLLIMWLWTPQPGDSALYFMVPCIFGVSDVVFQTHVYTIIPLLFEDDKPSAFANLYAFRSLSKAISFGLSGTLCVWMCLLISTLLLVLSCISFVTLEIMLKFSKSQVKSEVNVCVPIPLKHKESDFQTVTHV